MAPDYSAATISASAASSLTFRTTVLSAHFRMPSRASGLRSATRSMAYSPVSFTNSMWPSIRKTSFRARASLCPPALLPSPAAIAIAIQRSTRRIRGASRSASRSISASAGNTTASSTTLIPRSIRISTRDPVLHSSSRSPPAPYPPFRTTRSENSGNPTGAISRPASAWHTTSSAMAAPSCAAATASLTNARSAISLTTSSRIRRTMRFFRSSPARICRPSRFKPATPGPSQPPAARRFLLPPSAPSILACAPHTLTSSAPVSNAHSEAAPRASRIPVPAASGSTPSRTSTRWARPMSISALPAFPGHLDLPEPAPRASPPNTRTSISARTAEPPLTTQP